MTRAIKSLLATLVVSLSLATPALAGPLEDGKAAFDRKDYATALRLWRPLAEQGAAIVQFQIGYMYSAGQGVPQDYVMAHKWLNLAAARGFNNAASDREIVARKITPAQIAEAQQLAREWKPKK